ncbi:MAG: hypothetical protein BGN87_00285 [Rhizobiales bacterium 65-79]|nr:hypothetical protein [Hyphomicrobiales bacterium]OJU02622.1 MAG: hypothetical protein BGN87_00285 [Rhizobiales bacterium 65-79]
MSDADITKLPPPNEFAADDGGLTRWHAAFDGITVRPVFKGVFIEAFRGDQTVGFSLTQEQARHLAKLLAEAAK